MSNMYTISHNGTIKSITNNINDCAQIITEIDRTIDYIECVTLLKKEFNKITVPEKQFDYNSDIQITFQKG